jgi:hypothetical protein
VSNTTKVPLRLVATTPPVAPTSAILLRRVRRRCPEWRRLRVEPDPEQVACAGGAPAAPSETARPLRGKDQLGGRSSGLADRSGMLASLPLLVSHDASRGSLIALTDSDPSGGRTPESGFGSPCPAHGGEEPASRGLESLPVRVGRPLARAPADGCASGPPCLGAAHDRSRSSASPAAAPDGGGTEHAAARAGGIPCRRPAPGSWEPSNLAGALRARSSARGRAGA